MSRRTVFFAAALCALAAVGQTKVATQEWVAKKLADVGMRISTASVETNVVEGVTNVVYSSSFKCDEVPGFNRIQLVVSPIESSSGDASVDRSLPYISCVIRDVVLWDAEGTRVSFAQGWELARNINMPDPMPTGVHQCELGDDCNCTMAGNTRESVLENVPDDYKDVTFEEISETLKSPLDMVEDLDAWGSESWQKKIVVGQTVLYYVTDSPADGSSPRTFNVTAIGASDAWMECLKQMQKKWNEYLKLVRDLYADQKVCNHENPQHSWQTTTCGTHSWSVCLNNPAHTQGSEGHDYPGSTYNASWHSCICGHKTEAHGTLVASGTATLTYNGDGKETGWTQTMVCPKGCGYSETKTHTHHFTNCGTCDAGDGCSTVCTGCNGEHVWGEATVTGIAENDLCAKCECTMCEGCNANPPATNMTLHAGWMPCGVDPEIDNDDGTAKGAHCQCQCLTFGHNAAIHGINESEHDYQRSEGMDVYEEIKDHTAPTRAATYHYEILGQCTRCKQYKKQLEEHDWPSDPTRYQYVSDSVCAYVYECKKCHRDKRDETHGHNLGSTIVYENVSASICRQKKQCQNKGCGAWINDDTHGHTRGEECKCANGCGYQFEHGEVQDACGNTKCPYCGAYKYSQESHSGYKSGGTYSAAGHQCACGSKPDVPHVYGTPTVVSQAGWSTILRHTCTACPYYYDEEVNTNPCRNGHVALQDACGCACGYYSPSNNVSTSTEFHKWDSSDTDSDGVENCMCKCNTLHTFRSSTYLNNSGTRCPNVCAYCRLRKRDGTYADEDDHEPKASRFERCGCACGRLDSSAKANKFHIPKPGTCTCYGGDGNGGTRHFKHPKTGCTRICAYLKDGEEHLTAARDGEEGTTAAYPKDHTKTDTTGLCGCKCRKYDGDEAECPSTFHVQNPTGCGCYCTHSSKSGHHRWPSNSCRCYCLEEVDHKWSEGACYCLCGNKHRIIQRQDGKCPRVCHGPCNEYLYARDKHTPKDDSCGCECGQFAGADYTDLAFHHGHGSPYCMCACGLHHVNSTRRLDCTGICSQCGDHKTNYALVDPVQAAPAEAHSWTADSCYCKCGKFVNHKFASNSCTCYCEATHRSHLWRIQSDGVIGSHTCETCGKTISEHEVVYECSRCGELIEGYYETGHADSCGDAHDNDSNLDPCGCGCTDCSCSACSSGTGRCTTCGELCGDEEGNGGGAGGGSGGSTGGGGGYRDI